MTGASSATSPSDTRSPVVSYPAKRGSPARTTSSAPSTIPYLMASLWLNRAIFTRPHYRPRRVERPPGRIRTGARSTRGSGVEAVQPAPRVLAAAVLDVGELLAQRQAELARRLLVGEALREQRADRRDDGGRAAREHLDDVAR